MADGDGDTDLGNRFADLARQLRAQSSADSHHGPGHVAAAEIRASRVAAMAKKSSPFWRDMLANIDPSRATWDVLPVVDRAMFARRLDDTFTDSRLTTDVIARHFREHAARLLYGQYSIFYSAGVGGSPLFYVYDWLTWVTYGAALLRALGRAGAPTNVPVALLGSDDSRHTLPRLAPLFASGGVIGLQDGSDSAWRKLETMMPPVLIGYSSALGMAARAQLKGDLRIRPQYILAGSDYLSEADRESIFAAWNTNACVYYSTTEAGIIASQCAKGGSLHINQDHVLVEQRNGDLLVTQLTNRAQPTVRYRLPERGRLVTGPCPCGSGGPRLVIDPGRTRQPLMLATETGRWAEVHPIIMRTALDEFGPELRFTWDAPVGTVQITGPRQHLDAARVAAERALARAGAPAPVRTTSTGRA
jgi:phenylacetate-coenzyme A ligase PaaK-like adenylate-forming protein